MSLLDGLYYLRPDAKFTEDRVNPFSYETIAQTYIGTLPSEEELSQASSDAELLAAQERQAGQARRARLANRQPDAVPVTWGDLKDLLDELGL